MKNEYEAKSIKINKESLRSKLKQLGGTLISEERKYIRKTYDIPHGVEIDQEGSKWARLRTDSITTTLTLKISNAKIDGVKEIEIAVDDFYKTAEFLETTGFTQRNIQENLRERWTLNGVEIDIDTWPMIDPYVEVEGKNEKEVQAIFKLLGLDYSKAYFGSSDVVYLKEYGIDIIKMPTLKFDS